MSSVYPYGEGESEEERTGGGEGGERGEWSSSTWDEFDSDAYDVGDNFAAMVRSSSSLRNQNQNKNNEDMQNENGSEHEKNLHRLR